MIDTLRIYEELRETLSDAAARKLALIMGRVYEELANVVTKEDFSELKKTVQSLADAQKRTEEQVRELAEAQKKTEQRLTGLEKVVEELAEAQKKTEQRLNELVEAQKKTEQRLNELAEAQKKTEQEIRKLSVGLRRTREQVGGLARSVAYALENEAYIKLPQYLRDNYGIEITEKFIRTEIKEEEINLFARGRKNGKKVVIVGESVLKLDDMEKLKAVLEKVDVVIDEVEEEVVPIIVTHFAKKKVLEGAKKRGIIVVQSFQW